jgi:hypothetical protein
MVLLPGYFHLQITPDRVIRESRRLIIQEDKREKRRKKQTR